ncbi:glycosyltransferase family 4 protein [Cytophagales bacterium LB-30]|uniref:Glycosyltransferase family 4 protein n=1 Tax=Shiella aurantiaca TaxID=3058365 RepID=A0ABT8F2G7_9BACT|nr:glycosyltransferase family 4 protein [Shiella aurantiaca]MDN4164635.1 glycosyltransferase family 4 protein [Shiella aurantiaca]
MKILFLTDNFPPEVNAPATRTFEHCREWVKQGAEVTVVTCYPNFPQGKVYEGYKNKFFKKEERIEGVRVIRVWTYITANEGFIKRTLDYLSFAFSSFWASLFIKTDVIVATSPQFFTTFSGYLLSVLKSKPWIFELRDLWPESIRSLTPLSSHWSLDLLEKIELFLYRKSNRVVAVTEAFKVNLMERGIDGDKIEVVTNGSNLSLFNPSVSGQEVRMRHSLQGKFVVSYIGTHGLAHRLDVFVDNLEKCAIYTDIHFLFVGTGAEKQRLVDLANKKQLKNITFMDSVPKDEIVKYWAATDVSLIPLKKDDTFKTVIPSKMFEAAAMGKPILLGVEGQAAEIISRYGCGFLFEPENFSDFFEKLLVLKTSKEQYEVCSEAGFQMARDFDRNLLANKMLHILNSVAKK